MFRFVAAATVVAALLSGCSTEVRPTPAPTGGPAPTAATTEDTSTNLVTASCLRVLSQEAAEELAGVTLPEPEPALSNHVRSCVWLGVHEQVQAISLPADQWIVALPDLVRTILESDFPTTAAQRRRFERGIQLAQSSGHVSADGACQIFSDMVELQGARPGATSVLNVLPDAQDPLGVSAQSCRGGRFASISLFYSGPDDFPVAQAAQRAKVALSEVSTS